MWHVTKLMPLGPAPTANTMTEIPHGLPKRLGGPCLVARLSIRVAVATAAS